VTMVSKVIPCKGSRGWVMAGGWVIAELDLSGCRVPIAAEFHKWAPWARRQDRSEIDDQNEGQWEAGEHSKTRK
jgi:hypothetical protein